MGRKAKGGNKKRECIKKRHAGFEKKGLGQELRPSHPRGKGKGVDGRAPCKNQARGETRRVPMKVGTNFLLGGERTQRIQQSRANLGKEKKK